MVAVSDFSGLAISACALASAVARAPILWLDRCMARLLTDDVKADGAGLRALGADAMTRGFPGVLGHQGLQLGPRSLMVQGCLPGRLKQAGKLGPGVGSAHIDGPDRLDSWLWRLDAKQVRDFTCFHAAPELFLG